jgi:hypothetical protein
VPEREAVLWNWVTHRRAGDSRKRH